MQASSAPARVRINHRKKAMSFLSPTSSVPSHRLHFDLSVARIMGFHIRRPFPLEDPAHERLTSDLLVREHEDND
ncbi:MAG: hypothetical protein OXL36_21270 [Bryobacterales bacterium]|nr:hypothetical protein [Bryobacterales bacterium]